MLLYTWRCAVPNVKFTVRGSSADAKENPFQCEQETGGTIKLISAPYQDLQHCVIFNTHLPRTLHLQDFLRRRHPGGTQVQFGGAYEPKSCCGHKPLKFGVWGGPRSTLAKIGTKELRVPLENSTKEAKINLKIQLFHEADCDHTCVQTTLLLKFVFHRSLNDFPV